MRTVRSTPCGYLALFGSVLVFGAYPTLVGAPAQITPATPTPPFR